MHCTIRSHLLALLVLLPACSDDGLSGQGQNSSTGNGDSGAVTGGDVNDGGTSPATSGEGDTSGGPPAGTTSGDPGSDGTGATTGTVDTEGTSTGGSSTEGSSTEGSSTEGSSTGEPCTPITDDPTAIGTDCENDLDCPEGYTCQPFQGFVLQMQCQILCEEHCECPMGLTCNPTVDKSGVSWSQCESI